MSTIYKVKGYLHVGMPRELTCAHIDSLISLKSKLGSSLKIYASDVHAKNANADFEVDPDLISLRARFKLYADGLIDEDKQNSLSYKEAYSMLDYSPETGAIHWKVDSNPTVEKGSRAGFEHSSGQMLVKLNNKVYRLNRIIWLLQTGEWPTGRIKHKDNNDKNLKWSNLYQEGK